ncbi:hypothetical protein CSC94_18970 [Zhengella mangrovi]|uniref:Uncharacterized protein n=1 Tax=Zhengella mangrovi TaxID=1982044 RepID=A0A2G1QIT6_9HYPH|nr:hypothetical protein [Zhengella mangrovi]PHP65443.1 hypothetical protein CSC94_18970 [Zhengella mangrovi]
MRVAIRHEEVRDGLLFKTTWHDVCVRVDFTHEERQIIVQRNLGDHVLLDRSPAGTAPDDDPEWYILRVRHLLERKPDRHRTANPFEAKLYESRLMDALRLMKSWLAVNADPGDDKVIEL